MKKFFQEFKTFAMRGNVMDMAVGIIIGGAFGKIVSSLVANVIMPPIGVLLGGVNFADLSVTIKAATETAPAVTIDYGIFAQTIIDFLIIALAIFAMIKAINLMQKKKEAATEAPAEPTKDQELLTEIRDLLKEKK